MPPLGHYAPAAKLVNQRDGEHRDAKQTSA
jgi:hypothetical protein